MQEEDSHIAILQDRLEETKKAIKNIISAIEQGIITDTTKVRLLELESEQADITAKIAAERADIITVSRKDIIRGLSMFRDGDIHDPKYRANLFDTFLVAVYLYDNELKIVFSFTGNKNTISIPFIMSKIEEAEKGTVENCSFKLPDGPP